MKFEVNGYNGYKGKMVICQAVIMKVLGMKNVVTTADRLSWTFQMENSQYGKIGVRQSAVKYTGQKEIYRFTIRNNKKNRKYDPRVNYDTYFFFGFDENWKNIEKVYIIPNQERMRYIENIIICKDIYSSIYGRFEVSNHPYDDILQDLMKYIEKNGKIIMVDMDDIEKWLEI